MRIQRWLLRTYGLLLQMYPSAFRQRFATEMLELAATAELSEWPLILGDTSVAIVRCWFEGTASSAAFIQPTASMSLGGSSARSLGLGFVLSTAILVGFVYAGYRWPPPCSATKPLFTHVVAPPR